MEKAQETQWGGLGRRAKGNWGEHGPQGPQFPPRSSVPPWPSPNIRPSALCHPQQFTKPLWAVQRWGWYRGKLLWKVLWQGTSPALARLKRLPEAKLWGES